MKRVQALASVVVLLLVLAGCSVPAQETGSRPYGVAPAAVPGW